MLIYFNIAIVSVKAKNINVAGQEIAENPIVLAIKSLTSFDNEINKLPPRRTFEEISQELYGIKHQNVGVSTESLKIYPEELTTREWYEQFPSLLTLWSELDNIDVKNLVKDMLKLRLNKFEKTNTRLEKIILNNSENEAKLVSLQVQLQSSYIVVREYVMQQMFDGKFSPSIREYTQTFGKSHQGEKGKLNDEHKMILDIIAKIKHSQN